MTEDTGVSPLVEWVSLIYFDILLLGARTFGIVISFCNLDHFIIMLYPSLMQVIFLVLRCDLSESSVTTTTSFCLPIARHVFSCPFNFNLNFSVQRFLKKVYSWVLFFCLLWWPSSFNCWIYIINILRYLWYYWIDSYHFYNCFLFIEIFISFFLPSLGCTEYLHDSILSLLSVSIVL